MPLNNPLMQSIFIAPAPVAGHSDVILDELERLVTRQLVLVGDTDFQVISDAFTRDGFDADARKVESAPVDQCGFLLGGIRLS